MSYRERTVTTLMGVMRKRTRQLEYLMDGACIQNSHAPGSQENDGVDESDDPFVSSFSVNTELLGERQVGSV